MSGAVVVSEGRRAASVAAVPRAVLQHEPVARRTIARLTGLSTAAVTRHCRELAELGLIREIAEPTVRGRGRPHVPVDIDVDRHLVGGVHTAHDYRTLAAVDLRGRVRAQEQAPREGGPPDTVLSAIANGFPAFVTARLPGAVPVAVGVAAGGRVDSDDGILVEHPSLGWRDVPVREALSRDIRGRGPPFPRMCRRAARRTRRQAIVPFCSCHEKGCSGFPSSSTPSRRPTPTSTPCRSRTRTGRSCAARCSSSSARSWSTSTERTSPISCRRLCRRSRAVGSPGSTARSRGHLGGRMRLAFQRAEGLLGQSAVFEQCQLYFGVASDPIASLAHTEQPYERVATRAVTWRR
ncbi:MAG TPA: hypothetical protein VJT49_32705 [Amycolatopsis sp.]|uniref:hypothetical protein n=1 Tax=Amycolatopsis sp. TaxID=37632 RepID=UPI002B4808B6|nr:hypothetical protein [Amycolatopsis sp.]HKS49785.1 hypothetical protein [Amycolatopsis sp.]